MPEKIKCVEQPEVETGDLGCTGGDTGNGLGESS